MAEDGSRERAGYISHAIDRCDLKPGDHIYVYRMLGLYQHHGIYIGEEDTEVIHFSGELDKGKVHAKITVTTLEEFLDGGELRLVAYGLSKSLACVKVGGSSQSKASRPAKEVISLAKYYAQNPQDWKPYDLIKNNCERFAIFCKTGEKIESHKELNQQKRYAVFGAVIGTLGTALAVGVVVLAGFARAKKNNN